MGRRPFSDRDMDRLGVISLTDLGHSVSIIDCASWISGSSVDQERMMPDSQAIHKYYFTSNFNELREILLGYSCKASIVIPLFDTTVARKTWRFLGKQKFKVAVMTLSPIPGDLFRIDKNMRVYRPDEHEALNYRVRELLKKCFHKIRLCGHPVTYVWLYAGETCKDIYKNNFKCSGNTKYVSVHSRDYESYHYNKPVDTIKISEKPIVYIDQNPFNHPDAVRVGRPSRGNAELFAHLLNNCFRILEEKFNTRVIVCAHPSSSLENIGELYPNSEIVFNSTLSYTQHARLVMLQHSTAITASIISKVPILHYTTRQFNEDPHLKKYMYASVSSLRKRPLMLDEVTDSTDLDEYIANYSQYYDQWMENYIRGEGTPDLSLWEIFSNSIH